MVFEFPNYIYHYHTLGVDTIFPTITINNTTYSGMQVNITSVQDLKVFETMLLSDEISYICFQYLTKTWYNANFSNPVFINFEDNIGLIKKYGIAPYNDLKNTFGLSVSEIKNIYKLRSELYAKTEKEILDRLKYELLHTFNEQTYFLIADKLVNSMDDTNKKSDLITLFKNGVYLKSLQNISGIIDFFFDSGDYTTTGISSLILSYREPTYDLTYLQEKIKNIFLAPKSIYFN